MRGFLHYGRAMSCIVVICVFSFASSAYAGLMIEMDYINQGKDVVAAAVEGGRWEKDALHIYWGKKAPDLYNLMGSNSVRFSIWSTDKYGDVDKHYLSFVGDLQGLGSNGFTDSVSRMHAIRETRHGLYANIDFHESATTLSKIDSNFEWLFEKITGQEGKGALGFTGNLLVSGVYKLVSKITQLDTFDFLLDPIFGTASTTAYLPKNNLFPEWSILDDPITPIEARRSAMTVASDVPEPASLALVGLGGLLLLRRKH